MSCTDDFLTEMHAKTQPVNVYQKNDRFFFVQLAFQNMWQLAKGPLDPYAQVHLFKGY